MNRLSAVAGLSLIVGSLLIAKPSYAEKPYVLCYRLGHWIHCAAAPLASEENDRNAKSFLPPAKEKATLYLVRPYTNAPKKRTEVFFDDRRLNQLVPKTYLVADVDPGLHQLKVSTDHDVELDLQLTAGNTYFVEHRPRSSDKSVQQELLLMNEETGRAAVLKSKLLEMDNHR